MRISPRIYGAQITANWGSQWVFWDPRDPQMRLLNPSTRFCSSEPLSDTCLFPFPLPTTSVLQADRNRTRETEEEDLATRVTLTPSQGHPSLSFPRPKVHAVSEAAE